MTPSHILPVGGDASARVTFGCVVWRRLDGGGFSMTCWITPAYRVRWLP